jgi:hypothetical protein
MTEEKEQKSIVLAPVMPLVTAEKAAEQWALFEALKSKLLSSEDYQSIAGKCYIKRSGFRKIAVYFGISDRILKEERADRADGSFTWHITAEAIAPNGRSCVGVGACDSRERKFAHTEHDVLSTAHTRAKSRAISDLVAGGVVSAEEMSPDTENLESEPKHQPINVTPKPENASTAPTAPAIQPHVPVTKETLVKEGLRQFPLANGLNAVGMINVIEDEASIVPEKPVKTDCSPIKGFLITKMLDALTAKNHFTYTVIENSEKELQYILIQGKLTDPHIKELQSSAQWAFKKAYEKMEAPTR